MLAMEQLRASRNWEWKGKMGKRTRYFLALVMAAGILPGLAWGQEKNHAAANADLSSYDVKREVSLSGTVQAFNAAAETAPRGAHVMLQTASGVVDVHVGGARLLAASHFPIHSGDSLRIVGENVTYGNGTQFVARILQNGTRVLEVRSVRGIPLSYVAPRTAEPAKAQSGAL
jgi:hypothetical protein